jgi:nucleoporin SEH1
MNSNSKREIKTDHKDLIQDIAFDFYGKRVATASLDQTVKIWNINEKNEWIFKEELKVGENAPKKHT